MRLALLALALLAAPVASAQGALSFDTDRQDLGAVEEGAVPTVTFRFTNRGDVPLRLTRVEASCGCTTPSFTDRPVAPDSVGEVTVAYDSEGRPGPFEKTVYVAAGEAGSQTLRIEGVVVPALVRTGERTGSLAFDQVRADLGPVPAGEAAQASFRFANAGERPIRIERVEAPAGVEVAFPDRPVFANDIRGLFVTIEDPAALASGDAFAAQLVLYTTDPEVPRKEVEVAGRLGAPRPVPDGE